ncbi:GlsB/YeaQ/YmgE family stress response membrane protein [Streptomyces sp. NPDC059080]|uniref:GlsB/YeaQ/YmgE family stress response membrane protein n=1 Tax=Streptomyces sp. NPDC059080 TaxID=3346718 RepID=UPI0036BD71F3
MNWLWALIVGLILGLIAKAIIPGKQQIPLWLTVLCGLIGSVLGNWAATGLGVNETRGIDWIRHILQLIGAIVLVVIAGRIWITVRGNRSRHTRT